MACLNNLLNYLPPLDLLTQIVIIVGLPLSFFALLANIRALSLQRRDTEASIFQNLVHAKTDLLSKPVTPEDPYATTAWLNHSTSTLDYISFFIINDYLSQQMQDYLQNDIVGVCEQLQQLHLHPEIESILNPSQYRYLPKWYKGFTGEELFPKHS